MFFRIFLLIVLSILSLGSAVAASYNTDINVREINVGDAGWSTNNELQSFISPISNFFFRSGSAGGEWVLDGFILIAFNIKNFFIAAAVIFLIYAVLQLLYSSNDEEDMKKWRKSIVWITVGIFVMQIAWSVWNTLRLTAKSDTIGATLGWAFWTNIFAPIVDMLQMLASLAFLAMAIWAFYQLVTSMADEEKAKKAKFTILYAIIGFLLIRVPYWFVRAIYGNSPCEKSVTLQGCNIRDPKLADAIGIVGKILTYVNTFLAVACVILVIYAGFLVFISGGEEEKLKKAKNIIIYIIIGLILLVASHTVFRFFILKGG